jgi:hypothetical protein
VRSYLNEFAAFAMCDLRTGEFRCGLSDDEVWSVLMLRRICRLVGLEQAIDMLSWKLLTPRARRHKMQHMLLFLR